MWLIAGVGGGGDMYSECIRKRVASGRLDSTTVSWWIVQTFSPLYLVQCNAVFF